MIENFETVGGYQKVIWIEYVRELVVITAGFILSSPIMRLSAFLDRLLMYRFSKVSGLPMSGNFKPWNLGFYLKLSIWSSVSLPSTF